MKPAGEITDEMVESLPNTASAGPSASDVSFWSANSYRSGGDNWRQFLDIDTPDADALDAELMKSAGPSRGLGDEASFVSPMAELAELATPDGSEGSNPQPTVVSNGFDFLDAPTDDLLPNR